MSRRDVTVKFNTDTGPKVLQAIDRINVDDVFHHMVEQEVYRILTGTEEDDTVDKNFRDFLVKERHIMSVR